MTCFDIKNFLIKLKFQILPIDKIKNLKKKNKSKKKPPKHKKQNKTTTGWIEYKNVKVM